MKVDYYRRAVQFKEEEKMPDCGLSTQRRALKRALLASQRVRCLTCFICACVKLDDGNGEKSAITQSSSHSQLISHIYTKSMNPRGHRVQSLHGFLSPDVC